jgi:hypothetical protein
VLADSLDVGLHCTSVLLSEGPLDPVQSTVSSARAHVLQLWYLD